VSVGGSIRIWDVTTGSELAMIEGSGWSNVVAFGSETEVVATGGTNVAVWNTDGTPRAELIPGRPGKSYASVVFGRHDELLAVACNKEQIEVWDVDSGTRLKIWKPDREIFWNSKSVAFTRDGRHLLYAAGNTLQICPLDGQSELRSLTFPAGVGSIDLSRDGRVLAVSNSREIRIVDFESGNTTAVIETSGTRATSLSDDGRLMAAALPQRICIWKSDSGELLTTFQNESTKCLAFSPDGGLLAASSSSQIKIWNTSRLSD
jgi:WD40 repeat protein